MICLQLHTRKTNDDDELTEFSSFRFEFTCKMFFKTLCISYGQPVGKYGDT